ncbi:CYTH domain-containing protein, partial [bacterium]|nr:CYTH domain-containing protein [bacterium]
HPDGEKDALKYLRIRYSNNQGSICFKDWHRDSKTGKTTHCDEYETNVENPDTVIALFEQLGYTNKTFVQKTRRKFIADHYEIVIDELQYHGTFIEVELKQKRSDLAAALKELEAFLAKTVGITEFWIQNRGYVSMIRNPDLDYGEYRNYSIN